MYLVIVDAHSKWMDVHVMQSITSTKTIEKLRIVFATHGLVLPQKVVTDNGPSFVSTEFKEFMVRNAIKHVTSAPYHPSSNGLAERAVQSFKHGTKRIPGDTIQERISKFLFNYRNTLHTTTGVPPAQLLMGRKLRSRSNLLYPELADKVETQQLKQKHFHDSGRSVRSSNIGDKVFAQNFTHKEPKWLQGTVIKVTGPLSYQVQLLEGYTVRRHIDNRDVERDVVEQESTDPADPFEHMPLSLTFLQQNLSDLHVRLQDTPREPVVPRVHLRLHPDALQEKRVVRTITTPM